MVKCLIDINNDIISTILERNVAVRSLTDRESLQISDDTLVNLRDELQLSRRFFKNLNERCLDQHEEGKEN